MVVSSSHVHLTVTPITLEEMKEVDCSGLITSSLSYYLNVTYQVQHQYYLVDRDGRPQAFLGFINDPSALTDSFVFDYELFKNPQAAIKHLSPMFALLQIDSNFHEELVLEMIILTNGVSTTNGNLLPFNIDILKHCIHNYNEQEAIDLVIRQSRLEYESRNCGMVPTAPKARRSLKRVRVGADGRERKRRRMGEAETEICTVCLEELEDFAAAMPCGHLFHGTCIDTWLKNSHYCPVCRYEMPTDI